MEMEITTTEPTEANLDQELVFGLMQQAVRLSRDHQIRSLVSLRSMMQSLHPTRHVEIEAAFKLWSTYIQDTNQVDRLRRESGIH
jgi:hypothetical protein